MTIPSTPPSELSPRAKQLYFQAAAKHGCTLQGDNFPDDQEAVSAAQEITASGLGHYSTSEHSGQTRHYLWVTSLHPMFFTAASTRHYGSYVEIYTEGIDGRADQLIACLKGATIQNSTSDNRPYDRWSLRVIHGTATDFEHDPVYLVRIDLTHLVPSSFDGPTTEYHAAIGDEVRYWPDGVDPLTVEADDFTPGAQCTSCEEPHPFGPYIAPADKGHQSLAHLPIVLRITPYQLVDSTGDVIDSPTE